MSDEDRIRKLEEALEEDNLEQIKAIKRMLVTTVCVLGGTSLAEGAIVGLLLYKIFG